MLDEYFNPPTIVVSPVPVAAAPRAVDLADSPVSTSIDQDASTTSISSTQDQEHSLIIFQGFEESPKTPHFHDDPLPESLLVDSTSQGSSSNVRPIHTLFKSLSRWTKDHLIENVIRDLSCFVSTRKQLQTDVVWCYFDAFLTSVEPKNFKQEMNEPSWIDAMQEEIHEFERLQVKTEEFSGVLKNKARLVAQGFRQEESINFKESFAPLRRIEAIRIFIVKAATMNMMIFQMDDNPSHVYKLKKALYSLKQAPRAWYDMLSSFLISQHFSKGAVDPTLFTQKVGNDLLMIKQGVRILDALSDKLVSWSSMKQKRTAISSTEAEYIALSGCCAKIIWMRSQLTDYGFKFNKIPLHCDNKSEIALCCNNVQYLRAKHIDVRYHFIKEQVENGIMELYFVRTEYHLTDIFTKPFPRERFYFLNEKLGMRSMSPETLKHLTEEEDEKRWLLAVYHVSYVYKKS
ncbi:retrovirus-related pol polyprotein from transposon TNT 1-94 [Tanacetum coccineum]